MQGSRGGPGDGPVRGGERDLPIVVYSHLRWDSVFQRPHHIVSRLARERTVLFVEEPMRGDAGERESWEVCAPASNLLVCRPLTRRRATFDRELAGTASSLLGWLGIERHAAWLYTPMALPMARALDPELIVYDCMDELSAFAGAPPQLVSREAELLRAADVVFTGGPSLYRAKRDRHERVLCLPSSVDVSHFRAARNGLPEPPEHAGLARPRLGFYGVLDERLDRSLLDAVAVSHPDWQLVIVGPVVKIDAAELPRRPNIVYAGARRYEELPAYLSGWDVCLLPFARNEATRFISPTKTLEYMTAEKPIVTTPIRDVVEPYGDIVYVGDGPERFIAACERALASDPAERAARSARMREVVARTSWDWTVDAMVKEIERARRRKATRTPRRVSPADETSLPRSAT